MKCKDCYWQVLKDPRLKFCIIKEQGNPDDLACDRFEDKNDP